MDERKPLDKGRVALSKTPNSAVQPPDNPALCRSETDACIRPLPRQAQAYR